MPRNRPQNQPRLYKFACCCQKWCDHTYTSHCGHCWKMVPTLGLFNPDDDDPVEWDLEDEPERSNDA